MELLSGYSDAGLNAFNAGQNAIQNNLMNNISAQQLAQQNQMANWNAYNPWANTPGGFGAQTAAYQQAAANSYGNINAAQLYGGGGGGGGYPAGQVEYGGPMPDIPYQDPFGGGGGGGDFWSNYNASSAAAAAAAAAAPQTGLPGNMSPSNYFDTLTMGAGYNPYTGPAAGYNPYDAASFGLGQNWQAPNMPDSRALLGYDPNASASWAPGQSWGAPVMNGGGDFWSNYNAASAAAAAGYRDPGNIDRYRSGEAYGQPSANPSYFDPGTYYGPGGGGGGYDPSRAAALPAYDPNSFANRYAAGGYGNNYGTPSQYTNGYTDVGGISYPSNMAPTGFQGTFGVDDPTGALPLTGWSGVDAQGQKHFIGQ